MTRWWWESHEHRHVLVTDDPARADIIVAGDVAAWIHYVETDRRIHDIARARRRDVGWQQALFG